MSRLNLIFVISLVVLAGVLIATVYFIPSSQPYPQSKKSQIIRSQNEWILQYEIANNEQRDVSYNIQVTVDGTVYRDSAAVKPGKTYTYVYHINPSQLKQGKVDFAVYREGEVTPVEQATYYLEP